MNRAACSVCKAVRNVAARASGGQSYPITVKELKADMVVVDLNHPLAGQRLFFEVNVRAVRPAGESEVFAGKAASVEIV